MEIKMAEESQVDKLGKEENAYLVINSQIFPLQRITTNIGRKLENDLVIQDALVSRLHAQIRYEDGQFVLYDMESTGGTFVNNKKVEHCVLYSGDIICLANMPLMFINDGPSMANKSEKPTGKLLD
jgi:pSer/pThr/pTyr-binding forkhead associated (FHA) protein